MKQLGTLLMLLFSLTVSAQSDFDIAQEFMSKKGVKLVPNERSATRGTDVPYSVFNGENDKGFAIVVNGSVVGYDINNTISEDDMPCCLKEILLNNYSKTVKPSITRGDYTPDWWTPRNITPIEPLITTHWSYCSPYNDILQRNGICTVIAFCQLLHYFRVPQTFSDATSKDGELLPITMFNHDLMLDEYKGGEYTKEEAYEVAKFYYYYYNIDCYGLENVYGMNEIHQFSDSKNYYAEIDKYLEEKIPIWVAGSVVDGRGHAFIIDGRDSEGRYHVNLGWGGGGDGYYVLSDSEEHLGTYNGDDDVLNLMSTCAFSIEVITPKLFSWSYTSDIAKPLFSTLSYTSNVYNLQGIKVGNSLDGLSKGVYIQNGKKQVVK